MDNAVLRQYIFHCILYMLSLLTISILEKGCEPAMRTPYTSRLPVGAFTQVAALTLTDVSLGPTPKLSFTNIASCTPEAMNLPDFQ